MRIARCTVRLIGFLSLLAVAPATLGSVPLASPEADRQAKTTPPTANEALVYLYRPSDSQSTPFTASVQGHEAVQLAPGTFARWRVKPGRISVTSERGATPVAFTAEPGRVYYVELSRGSGGVPALRPVSFPVGRAEVQRSRLVAQTAAARRIASAAPQSAREPRDARGAILLKGGSLSLADKSQVILGVAREFDASATAIGLEGEWFLRPTTSLGVELMRYSNDYTTPTNASLSGKADTTAVLFNVKVYFLPEASVQPFLGAGIGTAAVSYSGAITGSTAGLALQAVAGVQWRSESNFVLRAEYKHLRAQTEDDSQQEVDVSASGVMVSAGFYF